MDGTLLDSRAVHWDAWRAFSGALGRPMTYEFFNATFGFRNDAILRKHFGDEMPDEEVHRLSDAKEDLFRQRLRTTGITLFPGVETWLSSLRSAGWRQALASMAPRDNIHVTLEALGIAGYFAAIVSSEAVARGKPDPEVFLVAAARLGVAPARCVVIEDSAQGVEAAQRAGMRCIGVGPLHALLSSDITGPSLEAIGLEALDKLVV